MYVTSQAQRLVCSENANSLWLSLYLSFSFFVIRQYFFKIMISLGILIGWPHSKGCNSFLTHFLSTPETNKSKRLATVEAGNMTPNEMDWKLTNIWFNKNKIQKRNNSANEVHNRYANTKFTFYFVSFHMSCTRFLSGALDVYHAFSARTIGLHYHKGLKMALNVQCALQDHKLPNESETKRCSNRGGIKPLDLTTEHDWSVYRSIVREMEIAPQRLPVDLLEELVGGCVLDGAVVDGPARVVAVEPSELSTARRD